MLSITKKVLPIVALAAAFNLGLRAEAQAQHVIRFIMEDFTAAMLDMSIRPGSRSTSILTFISRITLYLVANGIRQNTTTRHTVTGMGRHCNATAATFTCSRGNMMFTAHDIGSKTDRKTSATGQYAVAAFLMTPLENLGELTDFSESGAMHLVQLTCLVRAHKAC